MLKVLFLDRDGVINVDKGYVHTLEAFEFVPGIFEFCRYAVSRGYVIMVLTNQSGIARGLFTEEDFTRLTVFMKSEFERNGIQIKDVFHCPYLTGPDRKPEPGMFLKARDRWNVDMGASVSVGDKDRDVVAGKVAGVGTNLLFEGDFFKMKEFL